MKLKVVLDTNILLLFGQGIDVFEELQEALDEPFEMLIPEQVMAEVRMFAKRKSKEGIAAKLAYTIVEERLRRQREGFLTKLLIPSKEIALKTVPVSGKQHADDAIVRIAEDDPDRVLVATLDKGLQGRLLKKKCRVLRLTKKGFIIK